MEHMRRVPVGIACLFLATQAVAEDAFHGRAGDLDIAFVAEGGEGWCSSTVSIRLDAPQAAEYADRETLGPILGRLRAAVTHESECPAAQLIEVSAYAADQIVQTMEMAKAAEWVLVWNDPATGRPGCLVGPEDGDCGVHADAYLMIREGMLDPRLQGGEFVRLLDPTRDSLVEWTDGDVQGVVRELKKSADDAGLTADDIRADIIRAKRSGCGDGQSLLVEIPDTRFADRSRQVFQCGEVGREGHEAIIVLERENSFLLLDMATSSEDFDNFDAYTSALQEVLPGQTGM